MTGGAIFFVVFAACAVEMVEAATIVLAMSVTRNARSAVLGALAGIAILGVATAALSPVLTSIPIRPLRIVVGGVCLWFGANWLRKAVLRASGRKALHDEVAIFEAESQTGRSATKTKTAIDRLGFIVSAKAVLLEGFEVVVIVLATGSQHGHIGIAVLAATAALVVVIVAALILRAPLAKVPENTLKFVVGVMLVSFGTFWFIEALGFGWPGGDAAILGLIGIYALLALTAVSGLRRNAPA